MDVSAHNQAVHAAWSKMPCPGCGGKLTSGWGLLPMTPLDPSKPPALCYTCDLSTKTNKPTQGWADLVPGIG